MANSVLRPSEVHLWPKNNAYPEMTELLERLKGNKDPGLTDEELMKVHQFLRETIERVDALGPYFHMCYDTLIRLFDSAESYRFARANY